MAEIEGIKSGIIPVGIPLEKPKRKTPEYPRCSYCFGFVHKRKDRFPIDPDEPDEFFCFPCSVFFGLDELFFDQGMYGNTSIDPETALKRTMVARDIGWVMILKKGGFVVKGLTVSIAMGDIVKVVDSRTVLKDSPASTERTLDMFMISVTVGGIHIKLYPHEFSPISFIEIIELRSRGEVEESYVVSNDEVGYFSPTTKMKEQIDATFGG